MESRMSRKKRKTKEKIYNVAINLFLEKGYDKTTIDEIAAQADVAKGTFFNYFPTKDALLDYLSEQRIIMMEDMLVNELQQVESAQEKILRWLVVLGEANTKDKEIVALVAKEIFKKTAVKNEPDIVSQDEFRKLLEAIIKEGQSKGEFHKNFDTYHAADIFVSVYFMTLFYWIGTNFSFSLPDEYIAKAKIVLSGLINH